MTEVDIISGETAGKQLARETKIISSCFLEIPRNDTGSVEDVNKVTQKEKG